jgi:hypothetical protein
MFAAIFSALGILLLPTLFSTLMGAPFDHGRTKWIESVIFAPAYLVPTAIGAAGGYMHGIKSDRPSSLLYFVWIIPLLLMIIDYMHPGDRSLLQVFQTQFVPGDEFDEGWSRLLIVSPTFGAAGYALARYLKSRKTKQA